ncbi:hypothetical protein [Natrinema gelatinilyticum]|uniref:hypothetical protein n=1 Tax=Natrinema gelatinilyticum TaxID=2961571 RepID=UPI0030F486D6
MGQAGAGFAVVADEIKDPANETQSPTDKISQRIESSAPSNASRSTPSGPRNGRGGKAHAGAAVGMYGHATAILFIPSVLSSRYGSQAR